MIDGYKYDDIEKNPSPDSRVQNAVVALVDKTKDGNELRLELEPNDEVLNPYNEPKIPVGADDDVKDHMQSLLNQSKAIKDLKYETNQSAKPEHLIDSVSSDDESDFRVIKDDKGHAVKYEEIHHSHYGANPELEHQNPHVSNVSSYSKSNVSQGGNPLMRSIGDKNPNEFT